MDEITRKLQPQVAEALEAFRVVVVTGPRQAGKTTLVRATLGDAGTFVRLDDDPNLQAAIADPVAFASFGQTPRAFDEVQRAGDGLIRAIKAIVDDDRSPGQFLLNGSADFLTVPSISESLAGRAAFLELWPLSQGELANTPDGFLATAMRDPGGLLDGPAPGLAPRDYLERVCIGGFPEVVSLPAKARSTWFRNYIRTVTQRDIVELTGARRAQLLPKVLSLLAARTAGELIVSHVHDASGLGSRPTTEDYISYLEMAYLVRLLPAWSRNLTRKITRHPKVHITDTGLAAHILGKNPDALTRPTDPARGALFESFAVNELLKQVGATGDDIRLHHLRDRSGIEIDLVAEAPDGRVVAIEVKASSTAAPSDAKSLAWLRDKIPEDFVCGIVLHTGDRAFNLGDKLLALPIAYIWQAD